MPKRRQRNRLSRQVKCLMAIFTGFSRKAHYAPGTENKTPVRTSLPEIRQGASLVVIVFTLF